MPAEQIKDNIDRVRTPGPNELFDASFVPDRSTVEGFLAQGRRTLAEN